MPQHAKRIRISRKALRQPDEFQTLTGEMVSWANAHRTPLLVAAGVLALIGLAAFTVNRRNAIRNTAAAVAFQGAHVAFEAGNFTDAATAFATVRDDFGSTPFGSLARLYQAHSLARAKDFPAAASAYQEYVAAGPATDYLRQEALNGLGHVKEASGDMAGALAAFSESGALAGPFRVDSLLGAARVQEAGGQAAQAREIYVKLLSEAPDAELQAFLRSKLPAGGQPPAAPAAPAP
jgi:predicted negative regulator of RcsB-dependent stress response